MRALRIHADRKLHLDDVDAPTATPGGVVVDVLYVRVLTYSNDVISGKLAAYALPEFPTTFGPGCIGRVRECGQGVFDLAVGDLVYCDPQAGTFSNNANFDTILTGLTLTSALGKRVQSQWREGSWADHQLVPFTSITKIPHNDGGHPLHPRDYLFAGSFSLSWHGLVRAGFRPGMHVIVNGATGNFGSCAVLVALAAGAAKVYAVGRNQAALDHLRAYAAAASPARGRLIPVSSAGASSPKDLEAHLQAAVGKDDLNKGADVCIDLVGQAKSADATLACLRALKRGGVLVLEGSMSVDLTLDYREMMRNNWVVLGNWMYPPETPKHVIQMIQAGLLDTTATKSIWYKMEEFDRAIAKAAEGGAMEFVGLEIQG